MSHPSTKGFTLIEVIVAIAVVALLAGIITPSVIKHLDDSKRARAQNDALVIGAALASFYKDVGVWPTKDSAATYNLILLAGNGNTPTGAGAAANWALATAVANADLMAYHLISNRPKNVAGNAYSILGDLAWRGPYQPTLPADPWGNRYAVNIGNTPPANANAVWVLSAGPDGIVQTPFNQAIPANGVLTPTGDDIGYRMK